MSSEWGPFGNEGHGAPHLRCPLCGMVRDERWFEEDTVAGHELERLERHSLGGRTGFRWERGLELTDDDVDLLQRCLLRALRRLQGVAEGRGLEVVRDDEEGADGWPSEWRR